LRTLPKKGRGGGRCIGTEKETDKHPFTIIPVAKRDRAKKKRKGKKDWDPIRVRPGAKSGNAAEERSKAKKRKKQKNGATGPAVWQK